LQRYEKRAGARLCYLPPPTPRAGTRSFFRGPDADIACRVLTRIVHVRWLREITFEPRWAPFPEAGVQFLLADLWRKWVIDEAVNQFGDAAFLRLYPPTAGIKAGWSAQGG
ncbi:hypothetical protein ACC699_25570, partial [Rhizobium ruizarguesonis]